MPSYSLYFSFGNGYLCFSTHRFYPRPFPTTSQSSARAVSARAMNERMKEISERIEAMDEITQNMDREFKSSRVVSLADFIQ